MTLLFLLLDLEGRKTFDAEKVQKCLSKQDVYNWRGPSGYVFIECEFYFNNDSTMFKLATDFQSICLSGMGDASLELALRFQRCYGEEMIAVNDQRVFNIPMTQILTVEDFRRRIDEAWDGLQTDSDLRDKS